MPQVNDEDEVTIIDFPQMVSVAHPNGRELFQRDVDGVIRFFQKKLAYMPELDASLPRVQPDFDVRRPRFSSLLVMSVRSCCRRENAWGAPCATSMCTTSNTSSVLDLCLGSRVYSLSNQTSPSTGILALCRRFWRR